jgi:hypothetical protein
MKINAHKLLILLFLAIFSFTILRGQEEGDNTLTIPKLTVKFNTIAAINPYEPTLAVSVEHHLYGKSYLEHEIGYVYDTPKDLPDGTRGFRYRLGYHFHEFEDLYWGVQAHFRRFTGDAENFVWRKNRSYQQSIKYKNTFDAYGFTLIGGIRNYFSKSSRWFVEPQFGGGVSWKSLTIENFPSDATYPDPPLWLYSRRTYINEGNILRNAENPLYFSFFVTLKVGFVIR